MNRTRALAAFAALVLLSALAASAATAAEGSSKPTASNSAAAGLPAAQLALQRALALFAPDRVDARYRRAVGAVRPDDATIVLRNLVRARGRLSGSDRKLAAALLARPTDGASVPAFERPAAWGAAARASKKRFCNTKFCVHWVRKSSHRPSLRDASPRNGRPDYIDRTIENMNMVWNTEIKAYGYRRPLSDRRSGSHGGGNPNGNIDIFISDIGGVGYYGYCTTDDPRARAGSHRQNSGYCVIDDDFSGRQFRTGAKGNAANKVTLAHEFFHAVQFAYDTFDSGALMEGTATWIEDEVFNAINDNRQYLEVSPLGPLPYMSLDYWSADYGSDSFAGWQYGTWIWYRFLSENLGADSSDAPIVIRRIWEKAVGKQRQGFGAITPALTAAATSVHEQMLEFGVWNSTPGASGHYREGVFYRTAKPFSPPANPLTTGESDSQSFEMLRRSNDYLRYDPQGTGAGSVLSFSGVSIPGGSATDVYAVVVNLDGSVDPPVLVTDGGSVPFDSAIVNKVILVFTNSSSSKYGGSKTWDVTVEAS